MTKTEIQLIKSLADKKARDQTRLFIAEGDKLIDELRMSHFHIRKIFATDTSDLVHANIEIISEKEIQRISMLKTANTSLALVEMPEYKDNAACCIDNLVLALDDIQNPGNLGTIIRLADWFGINEIVCSPSTADCFNPKVVQATMGAIARVKVRYVSLPEYLNCAIEAGLPVYGAFLEGKNIYDTTLSTNGVVVMGNEGQGISAAVEAIITDKLFIPPYPADSNSSESLNVAIATGIICGEFRRQASAKTIK